MRDSQSTSWQGVNKWYNQLVGSEGHYYHEHVVLPGILKLLDLQPDSKVLDMGCGQGILARKMPKVAEYQGFDFSSSLIMDAKMHIPHENYSFYCRDLTKPMEQRNVPFTHAVFMLSLQNMKDPQMAITNAVKQLTDNGELVLVLNHPCFRIPRQSGWGIDEKTKQQHRWINRYLSPLEIPITMNPSKQSSKVTWSFHYSIQDFSKMITDAGMAITAIEEWTSDKQSEGKNARMENRARSEFPLFLAIKARKM